MYFEFRRAADLGFDPVTVAITNLLKSGISGFVYLHFCLDQNKPKPHTDHQTELHLHLLHLIVKLNV
jgi:hypothetical protein